LSTKSKNHLTEIKRSHTTVLQFHRIQEIRHPDVIVT